jgi:hypothetical protein
MKEQFALRSWCVWGYGGGSRSLSTQGAGSVSGYCWYGTDVIPTIVGVVFYWVDCRRRRFGPWAGCKGPFFSIGIVHWLR